MLWTNTEKTSKIGAWWNFGEPRVFADTFAMSILGNWLRDCLDVTSR